MKNNERVTLQYSISLDELPEEMRRLAEKVTTCHNSSLSKKFDRFDTFSDKELLSPAFLAMVEDLRSELFRADATCSDMSNILTGFLNIGEEQPANPPETSGAPQPANTAEAVTEDSIPPTVPLRTVDPLNFNTEELANKIAAFKESMIEINNVHDGTEEQEPSKNP